MAQKLLVIGSILFILFSSNFLLPRLAIAIPLSSEVEIDPAFQRQILDATAKISFFAPVVDENGQIKTQIANGQKQTTCEGGTGLGTLVQVDGEMLIITHDHWRLLSKPGAFVEFHNTADELLLTISGYEFTDLIRYRDGGTIILNSPQAVVTRLQPVIADGNIETRAGDIVFIAFRHSEGTDELSVQAMVVTGIRDNEGARIFEMRSQEGKFVTRGNSGGGVWHDGRLVGNIWSTIMMQQTDGSRETWPTDVSIAAKLPTTS